MPSQSHRRRTERIKRKEKGRGGGDNERKGIQGERKYVNTRHSQSPSYSTVGQEAKIRTLDYSSASLQQRLRLKQTVRAQALKSSADLVIPGWPIC